MLDTDMPELWATGIRLAMKETNYNLEQVQIIFLNDVGPAFAFNLFAWEWRGWNESFVIATVQNRRAKSIIIRKITALLARVFTVSIWKHNLPFIERELANLSEDVNERQRALSPPPCNDPN